MQRFSPNDPTEEQIYNLILPELQSIGASLDDFMNGAYTCFKLGEVLYDTDRDPMVGVINRSLYRQTFFAIHELFTRPGTFEFYLDVFRAIFGQDSEIEFDIPGPGQLEINVPEALAITFNLLAREIIDGQYQYFPIMTSDTAENILGQGFLSTFSEGELQNLVSELAPNGIVTTVNLVEEEP